VKRIPPWVRPLVTVDGKVYGWMVRSIGSPVILYNEDLFQSMGLTVPRTFNQLLDLCRTIRQRSPNMVPLGAQGSNPDARGAMALAFASSSVYGSDPNWNAKRQRNAVTFQSTPGWRTAIQRIVDMKNAGCLSQSVASDTGPVARGAFAAGQSPMLWQSDGARAQLLLLNSKLNIDIFVPPAETQAATYMTLFPFDTLAINKRTKNLAAARAFVDFIAREKQNRLWSKVQNEQSPFDYQRAFNPKIGAKALDDIHQWAASFATAGKIRISGQATWPTTEPFVAIATQVQGLFTGQTTVDDVLRAADNAWPK
jgi:raffinose/stachyose/melibiose transport system substrate-binding protein